MWNDYKRLYGMTEDEYEMLNEMSDAQYYRLFEDNEYNHREKHRDKYAQSRWYDSIANDFETYEKDDTTEEEKILLGFFGDFGGF